MQKIAKPKKIKFEDVDGPNEGLITIEPLFPGYGMTLGNSLRRVLLSTLPGAAVTSVKIKGATHEFMALPHIKEDVMEILLNFKQLRMKIFGNEPLRLTLSVSGKKVVTAADINPDSGLEIKNPDLVLANITDAKGSFEAEINVRPGRGYRMAEGTDRDHKEVGFMEIDSIFSPVTLVSINVENTRVGKMTDWDKLTLNVKTDGTLNPEEAFNEAIEILVDQFNALMPGAIEEEKEEAEKVLKDEAKEDEVEEEEEKGEAKEATTKKEAKPKVEAKPKKETKTKAAAKPKKETKAKKESKAKAESKTKKAAKPKAKTKPKAAKK